jgi:hypothetical protein
MGAWNPWENASYCWVVICKNTKAHRGMSGHKIPLAGTDAFESLPVSQAFKVQCDECGIEHLYEPADVLRLELELPESFTPHPGFDK